MICEAQPLTKKAEGLASAEEAANYSRVFTNYVGKAANWRADEFIEGFLLTRSLVYGQPVPLSLDDFRSGSLTYNLSTTVYWYMYSTSRRDF